MSTPLDNVGGYRKVNPNEQVTSDMLNGMGKQVNTTVFDLVMARLLKDDAGATWESGFFGDDCLAAKGAGSLDVDIAAGVGFFYDSTESDDFDPVYKPVVVSAGFTQALAAHDPADPRYDILCLAPSTVDDASASVYVKSGGSVSSSTLNTRTRWSYTFQVVAGTPAASPSVPATPAGHIKIAECLVPASSGDVTVTDTRTVLQLARDLGRPPGGGQAGPGAQGYHAPWVPDSTHLVPSVGSFPNISVTAGEAHIYGRRYTFDAGSVAVDTANGNYFIIAKSDGTLTYGDQSSYATLDDAEQDLDGAILALVSHFGGGVLLFSDSRRLQPYDGELQLQVNSVPADRMTYDQVVPSASAGAWDTGGGDTDADLTIQAQDPDGEDLSGTARFIVELLDSSLGSLDGSGWALTVSTGTAVSSTGDAQLLADSDSSGELVVNAAIAGLWTGTIYARITPVNVIGGSRYVELTR